MLETSSKTASYGPKWRKLWFFYPAKIAQKSSSVRTNNQHDKSTDEDRKSNPRYRYRFVQSE